MRSGTAIAALRLGRYTEGPKAPQFTASSCALSSRGAVFRRRGRLMPVPCGTCTALARSECVCEGAPRMVLEPRPPVVNGWPRDLFPERQEESEEAGRNRLR